MQESLFSSRRISQFLLCIFLIAIALSVPTRVCAQAYFGTVSGELTDASGAVIPGATVTLLDEEKDSTSLPLPTAAADIYSDP
jgi:hypothetical protein